MFYFEIRIPYFRRVLIPSVTGTGILELEMQLFEEKIEISPRNRPKPVQIGPLLDQSRVKFNPLVGKVDQS